LLTLEAKLHQGSSSLRSWIGLAI